MIKRDQCWAEVRHGMHAALSKSHSLNVQPSTPARSLRDFTVLWQHHAISAFAPERQHHYSHNPEICRVASSVDKGVIVHKRAERQGDQKKKKKKHILGKQNCTLDVIVHVPWKCKEIESVVASWIGNRAKNRRHHCSQSVSQSVGGDGKRWVEIFLCCDELWPLGHIEDEEKINSKVK